MSKLSKSEAYKVADLVNLMPDFSLMGSPKALDSDFDYSGYYRLYPRLKKDYNLWSICIDTSPKGKLPMCNTLESKTYYDNIDKINKLLKSFKM